MKVYAVENHPNDSRVTIDKNGIVQCLSSRMGTGGGNTPFVLIDNSDAVGGGYKTSMRYCINLSQCGNNRRNNQSDTAMPCRNRRESIAGCNAKEDMT